MLTVLPGTVGNEGTERGNLAHIQRLDLRAARFGRIHAMHRDYTRRSKDGSGSGQRRDAFRWMTGPWWRDQEFGAADAACGERRRTGGDAVRGI
ncbi:hypothetical protein [Nocardia sp. Marseille-Q1738]